MKVMELVENLRRELLACHLQLLEMEKCWKEDAEGRRDAMAGAIYASAFYHVERRKLERIEVDSGGNVRKLPKDLDNIGAEKTMLDEMGQRLTGEQSARRLDEAAAEAAARRNA